MKKLILIYMLLLGKTFVFGQHLDPYVNLSGHADFLKDGDTVKLRLYKYGIIKHDPVFYKVYSLPVKNNQFTIRWRGEAYPQYINIQFPDKSDHGVYRYIVYQGDEIDLAFNKNDFFISGQNCSLFKIQKELTDAEKSFLKEYRRIGSTKFNMAREFDFWDSIANLQIELLKNHRGELDQRLLDFLSNNIYSNIENVKYDDIDIYGHHYADSASNPIIEGFRQYSEAHKFKEIIPDRFSAYSSEYLDYLIKRYKVDSCLNLNRKFDFTSCLWYVSNSYTGVLREQLIMSVLVDNDNFPLKTTPELKRALAETRNPKYRKMIRQILEKRVSGAKAFNFALTNQQGKTVKLTDFKGQALVLNFWFTGCGTCKDLAPFLGKIETLYKGRPVKFVSISSDKDKAVWEKGVRSGLYSTSENINLYTGGRGENDPAIRNYFVQGYPALILISKKGTIVNVDTDPRLDNGKALKELILENLK